MQNLGTAFLPCLDHSQDHFQVMTFCKLHRCTFCLPNLKGCSLLDDLSIERAPPIRNLMDANPSLFCRTVFHEFCKAYVVGIVLINIFLVSNFYVVEF